MTSSENKELIHLQLDSPGSRERPAYTQATATVDPARLAVLNCMVMERGSMPYQLLSSVTGGPITGSHPAWMVGRYGRDPQVKGVKHSGARVINAAAVEISGQIAKTPLSVLRTVALGDNMLTMTTRVQNTADGVYDEHGAPNLHVAIPREHLQFHEPNALRRLTVDGARFADITERLGGWALSAICSRGQSLFLPWQRGGDGTSLGFSDGRCVSVAYSVSPSNAREPIVPGMLVQYDNVGKILTVSPTSYCEAGGIYGGDFWNGRVLGTREDNNALEMQVTLTWGWR